MTSDVCVGEAMILMQYFAETFCQFLSWLINIV